MKVFTVFGTKVDRIFERLIPDAVLFLSEISPEQINNLELVMDEEKRRNDEKNGKSAGTNTGKT